MSVLGRTTRSEFIDAHPLVSALVLLSIVYVTALCIQRLYLSPAKEIPGPFLAKLTYW
jgi:hypothetical protein